MRSWLVLIWHFGCFLPSWPDTPGWRGRPAPSARRRAGANLPQRPPPSGTAGRAGAPPGGPVMGRYFYPRGSDSCTINKSHVPLLKAGAGCGRRGRPILVSSSPACVWAPDPHCCPEAQLPAFQKPAPTPVPWPPLHLQMLVPTGIRGQEPPGARLGVLGHVSGFALGTSFSGPFHLSAE